MVAFTLRLDDSLARKVEKKCRHAGCTKTGVVKKLLKQWLDEDESPPQKSHNQILLEKYGGVSKRPLSDFIGCISVGGNALEDSETAWFE